VSSEARKVSTEGAGQVLIPPLEPTTQPAQRDLFALLDASDLEAASFGRHIFQVSLIQELMALVPSCFTVSLHTLIIIFLRSLKPFPFTGRILSLFLVQQARTLQVVGEGAGQ